MTTLKDTGDSIFRYHLFPLRYDTCFIMRLSKGLYFRRRKQNSSLFGSLFCHNICRFEFILSITPSAPSPPPSSPPRSPLPPNQACARHQGRGRQSSRRRGGGRSPSLATQRRTCSHSPRHTPPPAPASQSGSNGSPPSLREGTARRHT